MQPPPPAPPAPQRAQHARAGVDPGHHWVNLPLYASLMAVYVSLVGVLVAILINTAMHQVPEVSHWEGPLRWLQAVVQLLLASRNT
jgi:hypothetical protein